jgi:hypothetical protein
MICLYVVFIKLFISRMSMLDKNRKRPFVCSKSLLDLKSMITQNVTLNNNTEKIYECEAPAIEKKKRKESKSFPNRNVRIEYSPKSSFSNRRIITTKFAIIVFL